MTNSVTHNDAASSVDTAAELLNQHLLKGRWLSLLSRPFLRTWLFSDIQWGSLIWWGPESERNQKTSLVQVSLSLFLKITVESHMQLCLSLQ